MMSESEAGIHAKPIQVLVTCGGGLQGLTIFKNIRALEGLRAHLFDSNEENISKYFYDHFFRSTPLSNEERYEEELFTYVEKHHIDLIVPATQFDLRFLSDRKTSLLQRFHCKVAVPDPGWLEMLLTKKKSHQFLAERGFPVQPERDPSSCLDFPLIGKPIHGWGGKGLVVIRDFEDFVNGHYAVDEYLWTTYLEEFKEYSVDFSVNHRGAVSLVLTRERLSVSGGMALISKRVESPASFTELIKAHFGHPAFSGIYNMQFVSCAEGLYITDLNPRIGTSAVLNQKMASNPIAHLLDFPAIEHDDPVPVKVVRYLEEKYLLEGDRPNHDRSSASLQIDSTLEAAKREGRAESKKEIAKELKRDGFSVGQIVRYTGLREQEIMNL